MHLRTGRAKKGGHLGGGSEKRGRFPESLPRKNRLGRRSISSDRLANTEGEGKGSLIKRGGPEISSETKKNEARSFVELPSRAALCHLIAGD